MSTRPTHDGVYRIKVAGKGQYVSLNSNMDVFLDGFLLESNLQKVCSIDPSFNLPEGLTQPFSLFCPEVEYHGQHHR